MCFVSCVGEQMRSIAKMSLRDFRELKLGLSNQHFGECGQQTSKRKDTQKKDDVRFGHKLSLAAAVNVTLWEREKEKERQTLGLALLSSTGNVFSYMEKFVK